jgi:hypothetical protein
MLCYTCIPVLSSPIRDEALTELNISSCRSSCSQYSNDPSADITSQSEAFQRQVVVIQSALGRLKGQVALFKNNSGRHHQIHYEIILETLQKQVAVQASTFQVQLVLF